MLCCVVYCLKAAIDTVAITCLAAIAIAIAEYWQEEEEEPRRPARHTARRRRL